MTPAHTWGDTHFVEEWLFQCQLYQLQAKQSNFFLYNTLSKDQPEVSFLQLDDLSSHKYSFHLTSLTQPSQPIPSPTPKSASQPIASSDCYPWYSYLLSGYHWLFLSSSRPHSIHLSTEPCSTSTAADLTDSSRLRGMKVVMNQQLEG